MSPDQSPDGADAAAGADGPGGAKAEPRHPFTLAIDIGGTGLKANVLDAVGCNIRIDARGIGEDDLASSIKSTALEPTRYELVNATLFDRVRQVTLLLSLKSLTYRLWDEQHQVYVGFRHALSAARFADRP